MEETSRHEPPVEALHRRIAPVDLAALLKVSATLAASLDLALVLQTAIESAVEVLGLDSGAIYLLDGDALFLGATSPQLPSGFPDEFRHTVLRDHPHIARAIVQREPVLVPDARKADFSESERRVSESRGLRSILYVPLLLETRSVGVLIVGSTRVPATFEDTDVDLCRTLAFQISLAVGNARLFDSVKRAGEELVCAYDATLEGWSRALEMRDQETHGHTDRVARMTVELAVDMGVSESEIPNVRRGALLHDIGKMVIPDAILRKPGPLTEEEWVVMRTHPEHAREFLCRIDYLEPALDIPWCHHEWWDGSGYPRHLAGDEIPLVARIFAVVDVFDALTSDRPYRAAWRREEALDYIREGAGGHFDPRAVDAFLANAWKLTD